MKQVTLVLLSVLAFAADEPTIYDWVLSSANPLSHQFVGGAPRMIPDGRGRAVWFPFDASLYSLLKAPIDALAPKIVALPNGDKVFEAPSLGSVNLSKMTAYETNPILAPYMDQPVVTALLTPSFEPIYDEPPEFLNRPEWGRFNPILRYKPISQMEGADLTSMEGAGLTSNIGSFTDAHGGGKSASIVSGPHRRPQAASRLSASSSPDTLPTPSPGPVYEKSTLAVNTEKLDKADAKPQPADNVKPQPADNVKPQAADNVKVPNAKVPNAKVPDTKVPDAKVHDAKVPDTKVPNAKVPNAKAPNAKVPDAKLPKRLPSQKPPGLGTDDVVQRLSKRTPATVLNYSSALPGPAKRLPNWFLQEAKSVKETQAVDDTSDGHVRREALESVVNFLYEARAGIDEVMRDYILEQLRRGQELTPIESALITAAAYNLGARLMARRRIEDENPTVVTLADIHRSTNDPARYLPDARLQVEDAVVVRDTQELGDFWENVPRFSSRPRPYPSSAQLAHALIEHASRERQSPGAMLQSLTDQPAPERAPEAIHHYRYHHSGHHHGHHDYGSGGGAHYGGDSGLSSFVGHKGQYAAGGLSGVSAEKPSSSGINFPLHRPELQGPISAMVTSDYMAHGVKSHALKPQARKGCVEGRCRSYSRHALDSKGSIDGRHEYLPQAVDAGAATAPAGTAGAATAGAATAAAATSPAVDAGATSPAVDTGATSPAVDAGATSPAVDAGSPVVDATIDPAALESSPDPLMPEAKLNNVQFIEVFPKTDELDDDVEDAVEREEADEMLTPAQLEMNYLDQFGDLAPPSPEAAGRIQYSLPAPLYVEALKDANVIDEEAERILSRKLSMGEFTPTQRQVLEHWEARATAGTLHTPPTKTEWEALFAALEESGELTEAEISALAARKHTARLYNILLQSDFLENLLMGEEEFR